MLQFLIVLFTIWLAPRVVKMNQIPLHDWLHMQSRWNLVKPHSNCFIVPACFVKMGVCRRRSLLLLHVYGPRLCFGS